MSMCVSLLNVNLSLLTCRRISSLVVGNGPEQRSLPIPTDTARSNSQANAIAPGAAASNNLPFHVILP